MQCGSDFLIDFSCLTLLDSSLASGADIFNFVTTLNLLVTAVLVIFGGGWGQWDVDFSSVFCQDKKSFLGSSFKPNNL
jgi:hypothetical protein